MAKRQRSQPADRVPCLPLAGSSACADDKAVEFVTIMTFDDWDAVEEFTGPGATRVLGRSDEIFQHYELVGRHEMPDPG